MEQLLATKLTIPPQRPGLVSRPQLLARINAGLDCRLTLVSAPAGFGKTTLVSAWAFANQQPVAWLSLDDNDNDLIRFLTYLIAALGQVADGIGIDVLDALQTSQSPQTALLLTMLVNELSTIQGPFTLVLDDCHLISEQRVNYALEFLINHKPVGMHLMLVGRVDPPIPFSRLRAGGQLTEIRSEDLRFTQAETTTFLNDLMDLDLAGDDITALETRTEGWIAGLQLAALSLRGRRDKHEFVSAFSGNHHYIIDYLLEEVLSRQEKNIQNFLCQSSILDQFCAPLCDELMEISNSHQIIRYLQDANIFLIPLDTERKWYRYHHLFIDFLRQCVQENELERLAELHSRASVWYENEGQIQEAVNHALAAGEEGEAARLVEESAEKMLEHSEMATLMKWVDKLPEDQVLARPMLCIFHAWALRLTGSPFDVVEARLGDADRGVQRLKNLITEEQDEEVHQALVSTVSDLECQVNAVRAFQAIYSENLPQVIELANQVRSCGPESNFVNTSTAFALGWAYRFSGNLEEAIREFSEAATFAMRSDNIYMAVGTTCRAAHALMLGGKLDQALSSLEGAVMMATRRDGKQFPVVGYAYVYMGSLYYEWNDLDLASNYLVKGIENCSRVGYIMDQVVGYVYLARVKNAQGDWSGAEEILQIADNLSQKMKSYMYVQRWVEDGWVRYWTVKGDLENLRGFVYESGLGINDDLNFMRDLEHIILVRALLSLAKTQSKSAFIDEALTLLGRLRQMAEKAGWNGKLIEILILQSLAFQARGDEVKAINSLERALILAEPQGFVSTFVEEGQPMAELLRQAAARGISTDYIQSLLAAFEPDREIEQPGQSQPLVEPLSERELEVLRLLATDLSGPEIAQELSVALSTVRYHTNNIYGKLSVHNRRAAVRTASELNLI